MLLWLLLIREASTELLLSKESACDRARPLELRLYVERGVWFAEG